MVSTLLLSALVSMALPQTASAQKLSTSITVLEKCGNQDGGCTWEDFLALVQEGLGFIMFLGSLAIVISISYAGWLFISGAGNSGSLSKAKGIMWNVLLGVVFMLTGYLIVKFVLDKLDVNSDYRLID